MAETLEDRPEATAGKETEEEDEALAGKGDASLDELMAKRQEADEGSDDSQEESVIPMDPEERVGTLPSKVAPQQTSEFVCKSCFLVKHRSQLADKRRMLCIDCA